jgi:glucose repression regulatory protein TUP1
LDFSLDGRLIVSGSGDRTARIWDMIEGTSKVLTINDPDSVNNDAGVTSVAISPNGQLVAAGSLDTVVRIWDVVTGALVERLRGHRDSVYSVAFTPDGKGLVSGSLDKTLKYWDVSELVASPGVKRKGASGNAVNGPGGVANGRKDADKGSQCTMNFTGHKVFFFALPDSKKKINCICSSLRIMYYLLPYHTTDSGLFLGQKIGVCSFGIRERRSCSVCCKGIRTLVNP